MCVWTGLGGGLSGDGDGEDRDGDGDGEDRDGDGDGEDRDGDGDWDGDVLATVSDSRVVQVGMMWWQLVLVMPAQVNSRQN